MRGFPAMSGMAHPTSEAPAPPAKLTGH
ncbi:hypothetical protein RB2654_14105 [Rhodobacterales bacterium HTCC2654]|uniref:Uncharacterized protein n=1 Tax=Maritimibacter alkaliphilus HTCC2654 TaxID=314271 RepID=A3VGM0_9RHOB|nr:hypothetical protein RB2654_14105 [Rhodobacterales bacterium HTCC2654] [Maritimibacter alkaliphilus HTCC2654]